MDVFDRAQELEEQERRHRLAEQLRRGATTPSDDCADCGEELAEHRKQYGTCIVCQTKRENHERHHRR